MSRHLEAWLLAALLATCGAACEGQGPEPALTLRLAVNPGIYSGLVAVAQEQGLFRAAGLEVEMTELASGSLCLDRLAAGEVQLATVADFVVARRAPDVPGLKIVASIATADPTEIVARRDRGIAVPADLRGKRVGIPTATASLYYFDNFLVMKAIEPAAVTVVDVPPPQIVDALVSGEVDAVCAWDSLVWEARKRLGDGAVTWPAQNRLEFHWLLVMQDLPGRSPEAVRRFLRALLRAQEYCLAHPAEARAAIAGRWRFEPEFVAHYWDKARLNVALEPSLILSLDLAAHWLRVRGLRSGEPPDFRQYIAAGPLESADPRAVTLSR